MPEGEYYNQLETLLLDLAQFCASNSTPASASTNSAHRPATETGQHEGQVYLRSTPNSSVTRATRAILRPDP